MMNSETSEVWTQHPLDTDYFSTSTVNSQRYSETKLKKEKRRKRSENLRVMYEKKLLMLTLLRALKNKYDFSLETNVEGFGAFDDIVFSYKESDGIEQRICLRTKHKKNKKAINFLDFLKSNVDDYGLYNYFLNYLEIIRNIGDKGKMKNKYFVIYTNIDLNCPKADDTRLRILKNASKDDYFLFRKLDIASHRPLEIFSTVNSFYQFSDKNEYGEDEKIRLINCLIHMFKAIDENKRYQKLIKISKTDLESMLKDYLNTLVFALDQYDEKKLGSQIKEEIKQTHSDYLSQSHVDFIFEYALNQIDQWMHLQITAPLTKRDDFFRRGSEKFKELPKFYPTFVYENELRKFNLIHRFKNQKCANLSYFISSRRKLWLIFTEASWLYSLFIYQALNEKTLKEETGINYANHDHHLLLTWSELLKGYEFLLGSFRAMDSSLLIIVCESTDIENPKTLHIVNEIVNIIAAANNSLKQIIVIAPQNFELSNYLQQNLPSTYDYICEIKFDDLTTETQEFCLTTKKILFQGKLVNIQQLLCLEGQSKKILANFSLDLLELEMLLKIPLLEIGYEHPKLSHLESAHFKMHRRIDLEQLKSALLANPRDIFAFAGEENEVKEILKSDPQQTLIPFEDELTPVNGSFILLQEDEQEKQFKQLCYQVAETDTVIKQSVLHLFTKKALQWVWTRTYSRDFYMARCFYAMEVDEKKLKDKLLEEKSFDFIIFTGTNKKALLDFLDINTHDEINNCTNTAFFQEEAAAHKLFDRYDSDFAVYGKSIHWLKVSEVEGKKQIQWYRSKGKLSQLRHLIAKEGAVRTLLEETSLANCTKRVVVLADEPGMGKTTTLVRIAELMKRMKPDSWVMKIDLNRHQALLAAKQVNTLEDLVNVLSSIDKNLANPLTRRVLMYQLTCPEKVVLLWDGFDEVKSERQDSILALFEFLNKKTAATVWVTTRRHDKEKLENILSVLAYPFVPLDNEKQIYFLSQFWAMTLKLTGQNPNIIDLKSYAEELIQTFQRSIQTYQAGTFISIPLRARMLAEIYQETVEKAIVEGKPSSEFLKGKQLSLGNIFEQFVARTYDIYFQEKIPISVELDEGSKRILIMSYSKAYGILAVQKLFDPVFLRCKKVNYSLNVLSRIGLIQGNEEPVNFIHQTFAEYFAAKWLAVKAKKLKVREFLWINLFKEKFGVVRRFFDHFFTQNLQLHRAVLENDLLTLKESIRINPDIHITDGLGRTALHLAAQEGRSQMLKFLDNAKDSNLTQDQLGRTALHYAACFGHDTVINKLLENYIDIPLEDHIFKTPLHFDVMIGNSLFDNPEYARSTLVKLVNEQDKKAKSSLYYATDNEHWDTACSLLLYGADDSVLTIKHKRKLLKFAINEAHPLDSMQDHRLVPIVGFLSIQLPGVILKMDHKDKYLRLLSYFVIHGHTKVIDALMRSIKNEQRKLNILLDVLYSKSSFSQSHLSLLGHIGDKCLFNDIDYLKIIEYFFDQCTKLKMNIEFDEVNEILSIAANHGFLETSRYLYEYGVNEKGIPISFRNSANSGKKIQDKKKYIITLISNIQNLNHNNRWLKDLISSSCKTFAWTRLHLAAMNKNINSVEDFLNPPIYKNINSKDTDGCTPLIYASIIRGRSKFIESLFAALKKRNLNDRNLLFEIIIAKNKTDGTTPLHWVLYNQDVDSTQVFLKNIEDIGFNQEQLFNIVNSRDFSGSNPIKRIYSIGNTENTAELLQLLLKYIKSFNFSSHQCMEVLKGSCCMLYDLIFQGNEEEALSLLSGIENLSLEYMQRAELISANYVERNNNTLLHAAASKSFCYKTIHFLLKNGGVFNAYNGAHETPLDIFMNTRTEEERYHKAHQKTNFLLSSVSRLFELTADEQILHATEKLDRLKEILNKLKKETWIDPDSILNARNREGKTLLDLSKYQEVNNLLQEFRGDFK